MCLVKRGKSLLWRGQVVERAQKQDSVRRLIIDLQTPCVGPRYALQFDAPLRCRCLCNTKMAFDRVDQMNLVLLLG